MSNLFNICKHEFIIDLIKELFYEDILNLQLSEEKLYAFIQECNHYKRNNCIFSGEVVDTRKLNKCYSNLKEYINDISNQSVPLEYIYFDSEIGYNYTLYNLEELTKLFNETFKIG